MTQKWLRNIAVAIAAVSLQFFGSAAAADTRHDISRLHLTVVTEGVVRGAGFVVAPGLAVTSAHVLEDRASGAPVTLRRTNGTEIRAHLIGVSERVDMAVMAFDAGFGATVAMVPGTAHAAMPVQAAIALPGGMVVARGVVSTPRHVIAAYGPGFIATMPGVGPGFSGGPVLTQAGRVVGMVAAYRRLPGPPAGSAFAPVGARDGAAPAAVPAEAFMLDIAMVLAEAQLIAAHAR